MGNVHTLSIYVKNIQMRYIEDQKDINHSRKSNIQLINQLSTKTAMVKYNLKLKCYILNNPNSHLKNFG